MTRTDEDTKKEYKCERKKRNIEKKKKWCQLMGPLCLWQCFSFLKKISALIGFATVQFMYRLYLLAMHTTQDV